MFEQAQIRHNALTDCSFADMDFKSEVLKGFYSIFVFKCRVCGIENDIYSEKIKQEPSMQVNNAVVSACFAIGKSYTNYIQILVSTFIIYLLLSKLL